MDTALASAVMQIEALLLHLHQQGAITDLADLHHRHQERATLEQHLLTIADYLHQTRRKMEALPKLPPLDLVQWARDMLAFPNLAFLEIDTSGLHAEAEVLRVLLVDTHGKVLTDTFIKPVQQPSPQVLALNGLTLEQLTQAPSAQEVWPSIVNALTGKYLLSYGLTFDRTAIQRLARQIGKAAPTMTGTCLMEQSSRYFQMNSYTKLVTLCYSLGFPLPDQPQQTALHRALSQVRLLKAMAQGRMLNREAEVTPLILESAPNPQEDDGLGDLDERPF